MLTVSSIAEGVHRWALERGAEEVIVTGGGARNPVLLRWLGEAMAPLAVRSGAEVGIHPDAKEAIAFAGLAWAFAQGVPGNVVEATGARGPRVLGSFTPAPRRPPHMDWSRSNP